MAGNDTKDDAGPTVRLIGSPSCPLHVSCRLSQSRAVDDSAVMVANLQSLKVLFSSSSRVPTTTWIVLFGESIQALRLLSSCLLLNKLGCFRASCRLPRNCSRLPKIPPFTSSYPPGHHPRTHQVCCRPPVLSTIVPFSLIEGPRVLWDCSMVIFNGST